MAKEVCLEGYMWDTLVGNCIASKMETRLETVPSEAPLTSVDQQLMLRLWICVVVATLGSILALALWFVIYKRKTRLRSISEDTGPGLELLQKTVPPAKSHPPHSERNGQAEMFQRASEASSPCHHLHLGAKTGSKWEDSFTTCRGPANHVGPEGGGGLPVCSTVVEHRFPLPATELGGTALVTTKTV